MMAGLRAGTPCLQKSIDMKGAKAGFCGEEMWKSGWKEMLLKRVRVNCCLMTSAGISRKRV